MAIRWSLLFWLAVLFLGAPTWVQISLRSGHRTGSGRISVAPYWNRASPSRDVANGDDKKVVDGFQMDVDFDN